MVGFVFDAVAFGGAVGGGEHGGDEEGLHDAAEDEEEEGVGEGVEPSVVEEAGLPGGPAPDEEPEEVEEGHGAGGGDDVVGEPAVEAAGGGLFAADGGDDVLGVDQGADCVALDKVFDAGGSLSRVQCEPPLVGCAVR